jgi:hypothetical protein
MASKTGSFLKVSERQKILIDLQKKGELKSENVPESVKREASDLVQQQQQQQQQQHGECQHENEKQYGTGCLACGEDDDHANLLLCEACNAEYHTYCLEPPLRAVPNGDWYCCKF